MVEANEFSLEAELERILEEDVQNSIEPLLETSKPLSVRVTTAQQICNRNDHRDKDAALVFDMRSTAAINECSLDKSVNLSVESFQEDTYTNWASKARQLEKDTSLLKDKYQIDKFKTRKRRFIYIIPCQ